MTIYSVTDVDDARLDPYRGMRLRNWIERSGFMIAEGPLLVESLLESDYPTQSVLVEEKYRDRFSHLPESIDVFVVTHDLVEELIGYNFHRGILACGLRPPLSDWSQCSFVEMEPNETFVSLIGIQDPENVGGILRTCAGLGIRNVLIGPGTADPLCRRSLRVSMGTALRLQLYRCPQNAQTIPETCSAHGIECLAASLDSDAIPLESYVRQGPVMMLFGNEKLGLPAALQSRVDRKVQIPMELGTDSLNVCVAAGIIMHQVVRVAGSWIPGPIR